uniref:Zinc finger protein RFP-like n=1 Tax=Pseudonaja textilis TaxID=8673 RepID=A0A670ZR51_PSETE
MKGLRALSCPISHITYILRRELTCSICFKSFFNPITLACGHNFCHACLVSYWGQFPIETACPRCQVKIPRLNFIPNVQLANITKLVEELNVDIKKITAEGHVCQKHPPTLQAFCRNELVLFCSRCDLSREHLTHDVVPVAEAAQEYKVGIFDRRCPCQFFPLSICCLQELIETERQFVITEFNAIRQFLEEQENFLLLKVLENLEKGMLWKKAKHAAILFREVSAFDEVIQTVKEKCQQSAVELLQVRDSKIGTKTPERTASPRSGLSNSWPAAQMRHMLAMPTSGLTKGEKIVIPNVTLDPDTAHPKLILSEDLKRCWLGRKSQNLVNDDKRFDLMPCVLGRKMFVTGRHYWDVAVENEGDWAVGVARSSMKRKGIEAFRNMEGIWAMAKCCGRFWVYMNPPVLVSDPMRWKIKKIRVSLNYAGGRVAFCDIERGNLLHAFSLTSYFGEPIHPFFWIGRKTRLSLCP